MGTHPIFESDFDCLTEWEKCLDNIGIKMVESVRKKLTLTTNLSDNFNEQIDKNRRKMKKIDSRKRKFKEKKKEIKSAIEKEKIKIEKNIDEGHDHEVGTDGHDDPGQEVEIDADHVIAHTGPDHVTGNHVTVIDAADRDHSNDAEKSEKKKKEKINRKLIKYQKKPDSRCQILSRETRR